MIIVGFILENDSEFLGGHDAHKGDSAPEGPSERTNLVY